MMAELSVLECTVGALGNRSQATSEWPTVRFFRPLSLVDLRKPSDQTETTKLFIPKIGVRKAQIKGL